MSEISSPGDLVKVAAYFDVDAKDFDFEEFFKLFTNDMRKYIKSIKESEARIKKGPVVRKKIDTSLSAASVLSREVVIKNVNS